MSIKTSLATFSAKLLKGAITSFKKGNGEAAPGLLALKIDSNYILNQQLNIPIKIIVSGTNGKTTTTNLIAEILNNSDKKIITNSRGSNLSRGIAATLINKIGKTEVALWEADEAALIDIAIQTQPTHLILTNLFRDQMDRYGEIDTTLNKWQKLLDKLPPTNLFLNADDPNLAFLGHKNKKHKVTYFGIKEFKNGLMSNNNQRSADSLFCPICDRPLKFQQVYFSHLGNYSCQCGFKKPQLDFSAWDIAIESNRTRINLNETDINFKLQGIYNIYNVLAAFSLCSKLGVNDVIIKSTIEKFKPIFGRQEMINIGKKAIQLFLIKNPTGTNQVIQLIKSLSTDSFLLIAINDNIADGTDVSWLWDVDWEQLRNLKSKIIVSGQRAYDMALRFKYAGINNFIIKGNIETAISTLINQTELKCYILPTYTAMNQIRSILKKYESK